MAGYNKSYLTKHFSRATVYNVFYNQFNLTNELRHEKTKVLHIQNKGAVQLPGKNEADADLHLCFRYSDSIKLKLNHLLWLHSQFYVRPSKNHIIEKSSTNFEMR